MYFPLLMPFLYFPEDKSEYVPALITMLIFLIIAIGAFILIKKISKKQEDKFNEEYRSVIKENEHKEQTNNS